MIIGRKEEIRILKDSFNSDKSEFFAVYGRRRIGKTYLISKCFNNDFDFVHSGRAKGNKAKQIEYFCESLEKKGFTIDSKPKNWNAAFLLLEKYLETIKKNKKVIFLDELSWMNATSNELIDALEGFWNGWATFRKDIILIVCSSAASFIINKIIHNKGGLHNRLTRAFYIKPFTLKECEEYSNANNLMMSKNQILEAYMILGGIPYYWSLLDKNKDLNANIDNLFFYENAILKNEFEYLYSSLFKNAKIYEDIVTALADKNIGLTMDEIINKTKCIKNGAFSQKLLDLEHCGFIRKYHIFGNKKRESTYQLIDNFTLFYFKFISYRPNDEYYWEHMYNSHLKSIWQGFAFERICLQHINQIKFALGISGVLTDVCSWHCKKDEDKGIEGSQIDLLIVRDDRVINLCEIKFSYEPYVIDMNDNLNINKKISDFKISTSTRYAIRPTWICSNGLKDNKYSRSVSNKVTGIDLFCI